MHDITIWYIFASLIIAMPIALTIGNNKNIGNFLINKEIPSVFNRFPLKQKIEPLHDRKAWSIRVTSALLARPRQRTAAWNAGAAPYISNESDGAGDLQSPFPPATWVKVCPTRTRVWLAPQ